MTTPQPPGGKPKKSVEEFWKELNARPIGGRTGTNKMQLDQPSHHSTGGITIPGLGTISRVPPPPKPALLDAVRDTSGIEDVPLHAHSLSAPGGAPTPGFDPTQAGVAQEEFAAYVSSIQRLINCLTDQDRGTRRNAATKLLAKLTTGDADTQPASPAMLQALLAGPLAGPLLGLLRDVVEKCRLTAVELWRHAAAAVPDLSQITPLLVPELARRFGHLPVQETAEEVRLGLTQLTGQLISRSPAASITAALPDLVLTLCRAQEDGYHDIKKVGAAAVPPLVAAVPGSAVAAAGGARLAAALVANLSHQHSRVRGAALEALDALVSAGATPAGCMLETITPGLRPVAHDRAPAVRDALFTAVAGWLGAPRAAVGSPAAPVPISPPARVQLNPADVAQLLPILLMGVSDPAPTTAALALRLTEAVGTAHLTAAEIANNGPSPMAVDGNPPQLTSADADVAMPGQGDAGEGAGGVDAAVAACCLPPPFTGRPGQGARRLARDLLPSLLPPVIADLGAWTVPQRCAAARSLHTLLVLAEDAAQASLPTLLPCLCSAVGDEAVEVAGRVVGSARVLGAHVRPSLWLPLLLDQLTSARLSADSRTNALVVLSALLHAAGLAGQALPPDLLTALATTLASEELWGGLLGSAPLTATASSTPAPGGVPAPPHPLLTQSRDGTAAATQLLAVTVNLMRWQGPACAPAALPLCRLLLALAGGQPLPAIGATVPGAGEEVGPQVGAAPGPATVKAAMQQLVQCCGAGSWAALLDTHAAALLEELLPRLPSWSVGSGGLQVLQALLLTAGPTTLAHAQPALLAAMAPVLKDPDSPAALRLALLQLLDAVIDDPGGRGAGLVASDDAAAALLQQALLPPLAWRAGKVAAAVRFTAITTLASGLRRRLLPPRPLLRLIDDGTLLPLLAQELDEDWYVDVRLAACYIVQQLLEAVGARLGHEPRRFLYVELLKRLDDSANNVRVGAAGALTAFCTSMPPDYCETNSEYLAAGVAIHMDDADVAVQEAAVRVLEALGAVKPGVVRKEMFKVRDRFRNKHCVERVLASLPA